MIPGRHGRAAILLLCLMAAAPASALASCLPEAEPGPGPVERYSREAVRAGRVPETVAITRATLGIAGARIDVAVVTDAGRELLGDDWPPFRRQARLMLVSLASGDVIWELALGPHAASHATGASDPRLAAPLGAAAVLTGADGLARRLYAGDGAGRVWRIDLPPLATVAAAATNWQVDLFAALAPPSVPASLRFRLAPDLVRSIDSTGRPFDGLVLVSEGAPSAAPEGRGNGIFFVRDYRVGARRAADAPPPVITRSDLTPTAVAAAPGTGAGWFAGFGHPAEEARYSPHTDGGRVFLVTASPAADCDEPPHVLTYIFNLADGRPLADTLPGSVAGAGWLGGPRVEQREIVLPGRGIALPTLSGEDSPRYRSRFRAAGVFRRVTYWRDLLLDAD